MGRSKRQAYISVPSEIISSLSSSSLQSLVTPKKSSSSSSSSCLSKRVGKQCGCIKRPTFWFLCLFVCGFLGMSKLFFKLDPLFPILPYPCANDPHLQKLGFVSIGGRKSGITQQKLISADGYLEESKSKGEVVQEEDKMGFWEQPDGMGYKPCLDFSGEYKRYTGEIKQDRSKYLMVVVSGGMNQQRNQIVDAVVFARILGAALVIPVFQVNAIWGDESEFADIFDLEHFKRELADDVRIVSSLPSTHLRKRLVEERQTPLHASPRWIRQHYLGKLKREGVLLLRGLDSRLSKDLPSDLQKLRCKVAFHALRFAPHIAEIGDKIAKRMQSQGPYLALHLRLETDVWVRTGCSPGLSDEYDQLIESERLRHPELLTARSNMSAHERKLAGLCPLNALEVARLLKALGAPKTARIYWAGGKPIGGKEVLFPLTNEFRHFYNKEDLALPGELEPYADSASIMAAIDYIVCEKSDVFMPSHGGNMGHALQGQRAYAGHRKYITPNKRHMLPYFLNSSLPEAEFNEIVKELHQESLGQPEFRTIKAGRDVTKYPVPECMCNSTTSSIQQQRQQQQQQLSSS